MSDATTPAKALRVGVVGAGGAMGRRVVALLGCGDGKNTSYPDMQLAATLRREGSAVTTSPPVAAGPDRPVHTTSPAAFAAAIDVAIDFSAPAAAPELAAHLARHKVAYVVASTGLSAEATAALQASSTDCAVLVAANTSLGVHVLSRLVRQAAALMPHADVEIVEAHHRRKRDAPSGTALVLGAAVQAGQKQAGALRPQRPVFGRGEGDGPRQVGDLGYSAVRGGDVVGEHTVMLLADGERIELVHRCTDATTFAHGALEAGRWLVQQPPGRYSMADVLQARG